MSFNSDYIKYSKITHSIIKNINKKKISNNKNKLLLLNLFYFHKSIYLNKKNNENQFFYFLKYTEVHNTDWTYSLC